MKTFWYNIAEYISVSGAETDIHNTWLACRELKIPLNYI